MDDLKKQVMEKSGLSEAQAITVIETVVKYIKDRVPPIIHNQLDKIVAGMSLEESIRNQVENIGGEVKDRTESLARDLKNAFEGAFKSKKNDNPG